MKKALQKAIELNAKCAPAFYYLGQVHKHLGDDDPSSTVREGAVRSPATPTPSASCA